ncbi:hypothetical protein [Bradyrhizobium sp. LHD-71]|uniref:hypothetical protein n=1 Tax=Bradyrhizobium sp. LHD-71 TaxID=3072141 RepID=UPI0028101310|nr:hypothetical protein [Bradyrhizobium sp. LHD-71]MDQ8727214.1 hypothetical protein [Bradyrhizobium sp. LHD-71]
MTMRIRRVLLAVFGLAVVVFAAYALNRGVLIGSEIHRGSTSLQDRATAYLWRKHCRYLRFTGINDDASLTGQEREELDNYRCRFFDR